jgi:hypothetical protein
MGGKIENLTVGGERVGQFGSASEHALLVDEIADLANRTATLRARAVALGENRVALWLRRGHRDVEAAWDLANEIHRRVLLESAKRER